MKDALSRPITIAGNATVEITGDVSLARMHGDYGKHIQFERDVPHAVGDVVMLPRRIAKALVRSGVARLSGLDNFELK